MIMKNLVSTELYSFDQTSMYVKAVSLLPVTFLELKRLLKIVNTSENMVSIPGISMTYMLNKSLEKNKGVELYSPGGICHLCRDIREELQHCSCNGALKCGVYCEECQLDMKNLEKCKCEKTAVYDLLRTGMVGGPVQVFTRYHEKNITRIRPHVYEEKSRLTKGVIGYDANALYLIS